MRSITQRAVFGSINADGTIKSGSGFVSRKNGTGGYIITFQPHVRVMGVTAITVTTALIRVDSNDGTIVSISTLNTAFAFEDKNFNFTAVVAV